MLWNPAGNPGCTAANHAGPPPQEASRAGHRDRDTDANERCHRARLRRAERSCRVWQGTCDPSLAVRERAQPSRPLPRRAAGPVRAGILPSQASVVRLPRALGRPKAGRLRPRRRLRGCAAWSGRGLGGGLAGLERGKRRPSQRGERPRAREETGNEVKRKRGMEDSQRTN